MSEHHPTQILPKIVIEIPFPMQGMNVLTIKEVILIIVLGATWNAQELKEGPTVVWVRHSEKQSDHVQ